MQQYDLIVVGGGAAGLTASQLALTLGFRVAIVEANRFGGECTWTGCIPSKALLNAAKIAHHARHSTKFGIHAEQITVNFVEVMAQVHAIIKEIADEEDADKLHEMGLSVYQSYARFEDAHTLALDSGEKLRGKYILLATGLKPRVPSGFENIPYLTHENLFDLREQPEHLIIVGGGPVGTEMAQAFNRLGTKVTLITDVDRLLPRDDAQSSQLIMKILRDEGVTIHTSKRVTGTDGTAGDIRIKAEDGSVFSGSHVLLAIGKVQDISGMNPGAAGIKLNGNMLVVDKYLRTSQKHIFAAGDAAGGAQFTHAASSTASTAVLNMMSPLKMAATTQFPWTTFTEPEVAQAGLTEAQARDFYSHVEVTELPMTRSNRAMVDGNREGFVKLVHKPSGKLLGASIVANNAGEMMNEWSRIIENKGRVLNAALPVHIYPTLGESNALFATEQLRHQVAHTRLGALVKRVVRWLI